MSTFYLHFFCKVLFLYCLLLCVCLLLSHDDMKSMAVEAILLLQERINDDDEETVKMQLLVPSRVIGCVIGRSGSVITQIRKRTNASICISKGNNDDLVEVIMILTKVQIFSPSFALYSTSKSLVIVRYLVNSAV